MRSAIVLFFLLGACSREVPTAKPVPSEVVPPAPQKTSGVQWGAPVSDLRLGIELDGAVLVAHLQNVGSAPLGVWSHVAAHEQQSDWLSVTLTDRFGKERVVGFSADRDKSVPIPATVAPGKELVERWDLADWAVRSPQGKAFGPDDLTVRAKYRVPTVPTSVPAVGDTTWSGTVESGTIVR